MIWTEDLRARWYVALRALELSWGPLVALAAVLAGTVGGAFVAVPLVLVLLAWGWYSRAWQARLSTRAAVYPEKELGRAVRRLMRRSPRMAEELGVDTHQVRVLRHQPIRNGAEVDFSVRGTGVTSVKVAAAAARVAGLTQYGEPECDLFGDVYRVSFVTFGYRP